MLPKDVLVCIFRQCLDQQTMRALALVCTRFARVIAQDRELSEIRLMVRFANGATTVVGPGFFAFKATLNGFGEAHVQFSIVDGPRSATELPEFSSVALADDSESCSAGELRLAYFADGDVWSLGNHAKYPLGYGRGSTPFAFHKGQTITIAVTKVTHFKRDCISQESSPTCAVSFFRDGQMAHKPFLLNVTDLSKMRLGVFLPATVRAECVAAHSHDGGKGKCAVQ